MSMLRVDQTLLGYRTAKWGGVPTVDLGNGRSRMTLLIPGGSQTNVYFYGWPIDLSKWAVAFSYWAGMQLQVNPGDSPSVGGQNWACEKWGHLEKTNIWWVRFASSSNVWFPNGLESEVYYFCPNHSDFRDWLILYVHLKNAGSETISFKLGLYSGTMNLGSGAVGKWSQAGGRVVCVKTSGYALVCGSNLLPEACYLEGAWRTSDYDSTALHSFWLRWAVSLDAGEETSISIIFVFGDTENEAITNFGIVETYDYAETLRKEIHFWHNWVNEGRMRSSGIYEVDQLAYMVLCTLKAFQSVDNHSWPASPGLGYGTAHWPSDTWPVAWAFLLWGHTDEIEDYFGVAMKEFVAYAVAHGTLYNDVHITNLLNYQCGSGYTSEWQFIDPVIAVQLWKKIRDAVYRDNIWMWISTVMDELDGDLITSGEFEGFFNHKNITPTPGFWESWILGAPNVTWNNTQHAQASYAPAVARLYDEAADLAEAKGEYSKAVSWREKAKKIRDGLDKFWTLDHRAMYGHWGDDTGYCTLKYATDGSHLSQAAWMSPFDALAWTFTGNIVNDHVRETVRLYHTNFVLNYVNAIPSCTPTILGSQKDNWMLGAVEKGTGCGDAQAWIPFLAATYLGIDDAVEDWFARIKRKYGTVNTAFFEEGQGWDSAPAVYYSMIRSMGLFLMGFAHAFQTLDPLPLKTFKLQLHAQGKEVVILKQTGTSTDQFGNIIPSYEPTYTTKAIVKALRADEQVVLAGFASVDDRQFFFKAYTPVDVGDRIRIENADYAVQTVERHHYKDRVVKKEVFAKKVI